MRKGFTLVEVLFAALIVGGSAVIVIDLVRATTQSTEVTEVEAFARGLAADVLERLAATGNSTAPEADPWLKAMLGPDLNKTPIEVPPQAWDHVLTQDRSLAYGFPAADLKSLLDGAQLKIAITRLLPYADRDDKQSVAWKVTASWINQQGRTREVNYARIVAQ
jgi:prepilin-type N-terminal cleavage/methylation domain-containing protein